MNNLLFRVTKVKSILFKLLTLWLVNCYYTRLEQVPSRLDQNDGALYIFVGWQHLVSCLPFNVHDQLELASPKDKAIRFVLVACWAIMTIQCILTPILAWFNWQIALVDTDYYTIRYCYYFAYILLMQVMRQPKFDLA